jgi:hypothetical protein
MGADGFPDQEETTMRYIVAVNQEGTYSEGKTEMSYADAHGLAEKLHAEGVGVQVLQINRDGSKSKCCTTDYHGLVCIL